MRILHRAILMLSLIAIVAIASFTSGCGWIKLVLAKDKLNQGVICFNQGNNRCARDFFKSALDYDPNSAIAYLYYGATLVKEYQDVDNPDKQKQMAGEALKIYEKALSLSENNCRNKDNAFLYIAAIYDDIGDRAENRKWLLKRAEDSCSTPQVRSRMYHAVAVQYWNCSFAQTQRFKDAKLFAKDPFHYRNMDYPEALPLKKEAEGCTAEGLKYIEKALQQDPEFTDSVYYKALLYREMQYLTKDATKRREYGQTAERLTNQASDMRRRQEEESKQKAQPSP
jgi:Tfp pilus assembly protein PilF